jgi:4-aminobutyrate aminotransferase
VRQIATRHPIITEVRGRALWIGLSFTDHDTAGAVEIAAFRRGLLMLGCGDDAIRISPALTFREDQARVGLEIFEEAVAEVEAAGS